MLEMVTFIKEFHSIGVDQDLIQFNTTTKPRIINCIISYMQERFQSIQGADPTLLAFSVFDASLWPDDRVELGNYGEEKKPSSC